MSEPLSSSRVAKLQTPFFAGIDVGGTNIKCGLVDAAGQTLAYHAMRTEQDRGGENGCQRIAAVVQQLIEQAGVAAGSVARVGLATPGPMDIPRGMILQPGNLPGWGGFPVRDPLSHPPRL